KRLTNYILARFLKKKSAIIGCLVYPDCATPAEKGVVLIMKGESETMFYISAVIAIVGAVGYQYFVKHIPSTINPIVSVLGMYLVVLALSVVLLPIFPANGGFIKHFRQLNWIQFALAVSVIMIELGFLMMYRYGWNLSTGNLITGIFVNFFLVGLGLILLGEKISVINTAGIVLCILGVALIGYRP
ncbi:MAG: hypothetical protein GY850_10745, partial [bacterium]|nr:hypothetical protein [bacterium]